MAPYIGIAQTPPTTMMDLEMAAVPSKSTVILNSPHPAQATIMQKLNPK